MALSSELGSSSQIAHRVSHRGIAFLVEALVVLAFLMLAMAVFVQLFAGAQLEALHANDLSEAVLAATNRAEEFSADPTGVLATSEEGDFVITCDVTPNTMAGGTLFEATIVVQKNGDDIYTLETSRYVSGPIESQAEAGDAA